MNSAKDKGLNDIEYASILTEWYQSYAGKQLYDYEAKQLAKLLPSCFGYQLLQLGGSSNLQWLLPSPIQQCIFLQPYEDKNIKAGLFASPENLPFAPNSLDVVILPHTLECFASPERILQEACQSLVPGGFLIILGLNRISLWGLQHQYQLFNNQSNLFPWIQNWLSPHEISQILNKNQCVIDSVQMGCYQPYQLNTTLLPQRSFWNVLGAIAWSAFGASYVMLARKEIAGLTPIWDKHKMLTNLYEMKDSPKIGLAKTTNSKET